MTRNVSRRAAFRLSIAAFVAAGLTACAAPQSAPPDVVETAVSAGQFNTLVTAVQAAGLVDTLKGPGPFTVFAPTDDAFAALPAGTVETLLLPENRDQLTQILTYHVVPGFLPASSLIGQRGTVPSVEGSALRVDGRDGVRINDATVVSPDVSASNGVIHVIDSVLLPN